MQVLKLGLAGSEQTLPTKSRINNQGTPLQLYQQAESINGTVHTDFIGIKQPFSITWETISNTDVEAVEAIILLQYTNGTHLSFIYTDAEGTETTKTVFAEITSKGTLLQRDEYFTSGFSLGLKEC